MIISIIALFPEIFKPLLESSILAKAQKEGKLRVKLINLRDFGIGPHKQVDDRPYGGGVGMILRVDVIAEAVKKSQPKAGPPLAEKIILLTPQGKTFNQRLARRLARNKHLILICGHYEGVDERVRKLVDEEISIGDYILSGGEVAAMVVLDAVARLIPEVLDKEATKNESFSLEAKKIPVLSGLPTPGVGKLLEYSQYTRPEEFDGMKVPKVLLSGNHQKIKEWRLKEAIKKTKKRRPDLLNS